MPERDPSMSWEQYEKSKEYKTWKKEHEMVLSSGGLHVLGTERHESRRIDNQLRGRSGRQGDPGSSQFYLCLEDDLMRIFGGDRLKTLMDRLQLPDDQPIENPLVSRAIQQAQVKVEGFHFDSRKAVVDYDDVNNHQRSIIYSLRKRVLEADDLKEELLSKLNHQVDRILLFAIPEDTYEKLSRKEKDKKNGKKQESVTLSSESVDKIAVALRDIVPFDDYSAKALEKQISHFDTLEDLRSFLTNLVTEAYQTREKQLTPSTMRSVEKFAYLGAVDHLWIDHLDHIEDLREGIRLRAYGQRDPLVEYKNEAFRLFEGLVDRIDEELSHRIFRIGVSNQPQSEIPLSSARTNMDVSDGTGLVEESSDDVAATGTKAFSGPQIKKKTHPNTIGRNDPCWCGSGKKWKKCHYPQTSPNK
jgi:preprotein translocase subunit SecA